MSDRESPSVEHLERARGDLWDAIELIEGAQRVLFRAGDHYVTQVWGDGVRSVIEVTEKLAEISGNLTAVHIEMGRLAKRDLARGHDPSG